MTIRESEYFVYDNVKSSEFGIINVNVSSGLLEEPFSANREIIEEIIPGNSSPYLYEVREHPLIFNVEFAFKDIWDFDKIRAVGRWLLKPYYKELYFSSNIDKRYYAMVVDDATLVHNCLKQGYVKLVFRCNSSYTYSPVYEKIFDLSSIATPTTIQLQNLGDNILKPQLWILKYGLGSFKITNLTNSSKEFYFSELVDQETVFVDNKLCDIITDIPDTYRYDQFNGNYLELPIGINQLIVEGAAKLRFRYQYEFKI